MPTLHYAAACSAAHCMRDIAEDLNNDLSDLRRCLLFAHAMDIYQAVITDDQTPPTSLPLFIDDYEHCRCRRDMLLAAIYGPINTNPNYEIAYDIDDLYEWLESPDLNNIDSAIQHANVCGIDDITEADEPDAPNDVTDGIEYAILILMSRNDETPGGVRACPAANSHTGQGFWWHLLPR